MQIKITAVGDERVFISGLNSTGAALSAGYHVCWNVRNNASANGTDFAKPATSNLAAYVGIVGNQADDTTYAIADTEYGIAQAYGVANAYYEMASNSGDLIEGTRTGPVDGQWYARSNANSYILGPCVIMSRIAAATFEALTPMFVRAL